MENNRIDSAIDRLGAAIDNLDNRVTCLAVTLEILLAEQQATQAHENPSDSNQQIWNGPDLNHKEVSE
jgi:hypothetical protein